MVKISAENSGRQLGWLAPNKPPGDSMGEPQSGASSSPRRTAPPAQAAQEAQARRWPPASTKQQQQQPRQQTFDFRNKFHRAALDGYVDMLCEASRRDTNLAAPEHQLELTPTLVAAQSGQLEALRILVGRGGDPERVTSCGSSALHLAAARNHLNCVSFLVNFGANMWALDNELHTAKDVAAMEQSREALEFLDQMMARQSAVNTKLVQKLKERAKNGAEKRLKRMRKLQLKAIKQVERDERLLAKLSQNRRLLKAAHSMGDIKLVGRPQAGLSLAPNCGTECEPAPATAARGRSTLANYLQQRLRNECLPLAANGARARQQQQQQQQRRPQSTTATASTLSDGKHRDTNSTLSSACLSASLSSTSGYLSSCSAGS